MEKIKRSYKGDDYTIEQLNKFKERMTTVQEKMQKDYGFTPRRMEGAREGRWAVLDYADVIVHIFNDEERDFYRLERLWEDGKNLTKYED